MELIWDTPLLYEHQLYAALMHAVGSLRRLPIALRLEPRIVYIDTDSVSESLMCFLERLHRECPCWKVLLTTVEGEIPSEAIIIPIELFSREPICGESSLGVQYLQMELRARHRNATPIRPYLHELNALCDSTPSALRLIVGLLERTPIEDLITHLRDHRRQHPEQSGMDAVVHIAMQSLPPDAQNLVLDMSLIDAPIGYPALISLFEGDDVEPTVRLLCEIGLIEPLEHSQAPLFVVRGSVRRSVLRALHESDAVSERMSLLFQQVSQWLQGLLSRVGCPETDNLVYESPPILASLLRWAVANAPQACAELLIRLSNRWSVMGLAEVSLRWLHQLVPSAETLSPYLQARILCARPVVLRRPWVGRNHASLRRQLLDQPRT